MLASNAALAATYAAPQSPPPTDAYVQRVRQKTTGASSSAVERGESSLETETELVPAWTVWPSKNVFCCWGHCMFGPPEDIGPNVCAWASILCPMLLFNYVWGDALLATVSPAVLAFILLCFGSTIFWFLVTTFTDPGVLARNPDPLPPDPPPPLYRSRTDEDGNTVTDTWCTTCLIYRPPRASHCPDCDNCVLDFDHHCPFTRNCIGRRNYPPFVAFLISVSLSLGVLLFGSLFLPEELAHGGAANALLMLFSVILSLCMWGFTGYHISLVCTGRTTKEYIRGRKNGARAMGCCERLECCGVPSELKPRALVPVLRYREHGSGVPIISHTEL